MIVPTKTFGHFASLYDRLWSDYLARGVDQTIDPQDKENALPDEWSRRHYFDVGADALRIIAQTLVTARREPPASILDFPSGSGRVTRYLRAMFPSAAIGACDLYPGHIDFCARHFGAQPLMSKENLDELDVGTWDLIFCGSLLTHLPADIFWSAIRFLVRSLTPTGVAIVTLEGRHSIYIQDHKWKLVEDALFDTARKQYGSCGFGFVDYDAAFKTTAFSKQASYGVALTNPAWLMEGLAKIDDIRILAFAEREWDDHQDVVAFCKPGVNSDG